MQELSWLARVVFVTYMAALYVSYGAAFVAVVAGRSAGYVALAGSGVYHLLRRISS